MVFTADKATQCDLSEESTSQNYYDDQVQLADDSSDEFSDTSDGSSYSPSESDMYQSLDDAEMDHNSTSEDDEWYYQSISYINMVLP